MATRDEFTRAWILENALEEIGNYEEGVLTLRGLHYLLVSRGMTNSLRHYKRVVSAMIEARRDGVVSYYTFSDHDRSVLGNTPYKATDIDSSVEEAKEQITLWMTGYYKNKWENQDDYVEVWIEKKALQGVFQSVCKTHRVALAPCKGYPSLTFLNDAKDRFVEATSQGKNCVILYFGDYDASGENIPETIQKNLNELGAEVTVERRALMEEQVVEWGLPPAPTKEGDSRGKTWEGLGQVELDAVKPSKIQELCNDAIEDHFDSSKYNALKDQEADERREYVVQLKEYVSTL